MEFEMRIKGTFKMDGPEREIYVTSGEHKNITPAIVFYAGLAMAKNTLIRAEKELNPDDYQELKAHFEAMVTSLLSDPLA